MQLLTALAPPASDDHPPALRLCASPEKYVGLLITAARDVAIAAHSAEKRFLPSQRSAPDQRYARGPLSGSLLRHHPRWPHFGNLGKRMDYTGLLPGFRAAIKAKLPSLQNRCLAALHPSRQHRLELTGMDPGAWLPSADGGFTPQTRSHKARQFGFTNVPLE